MLYPTYQVNGTAMADPLGRWHEHPEQSTFPAFPGLRVSSLSIPGVGGELLLPQAPLEPVDFVLHMVVNAVDNDGNKATTWAKRRQQLNSNIQTLLRTISASAMTQGAQAEIVLHHSSVDSVLTRGRLVTSSEIEYSPGADFAELQLVFRLPVPTWRGKDVNERVVGIGSQNITGLASSTAPIDGPLITLTGPFTYLQVANQYGNGFRYDRQLTDTEAVTINTATWTATDPFTVTAGQATVPASTGPFLPAPQLSSVGQSSGVALTLLPDGSGAPLIFVGSGRLSSSTAAHIHTQEAFF